MNKPKKPVDVSKIAFPHAVTCGSATVKIYKVENKGRDSFTVSYSTQGKRKLKMLSDFGDAETYAESAAKKIAHGELNALHLSSADALVFVNAANEARPTGLPLDLIAKEYAEMWRILEGEISPLEAVRDYKRRNMKKLPSKTVSEAVKEMLETKEREGASADYRKVLRLYLDQFAEACPMQVRAVATSHVADFLRDLKVGSAEKKTERLATARTKNNARATLGAFFKFCKERGWLARDHEGIEFVPKFREKGGDIEILTLWELSQYLAHAREEMIPFLAIGGFAGLRTAEITRLDWSEVHLADRFIEIKAGKAKTASRRIVPITDNLAAWLKGRAQEAGRVMPFDNVPKQIGWLVEDVNAELKKKAKADGKDPDKAQQVKWKHNGLRHSFISYRVADIQNANQVALEAGNSPAMIFKHYRELVRPAEAAKWFALKPARVKARKRNVVPQLRVLPTGGGGVNSPHQIHMCDLRLPRTIHRNSNRGVTPEERARAVVAHFPQIPPKIRADVESIITRAIKRALNEQLAGLEIEATRTAERFVGRGKSNKFGDPAAVHFHSQWARELRRLRTGVTDPNDLRHWRDLDLMRRRRNGNGK